jgi:broad-specificity NMP kinase
MGRQLPNVLVTGTPGTGKSTTSQQIAEATGLQYVNIGELVKSQELHCGWDKEFDCHIVDEDKVMLLGVQCTSLYHSTICTILRCTIIVLTDNMACWIISR